jgi:hypothetical protein
MSAHQNHLVPTTNRKSLMARTNTFVSSLLNYVCSRADWKGTARTQSFAGKIWRALEWKLLLYFMTIWNILRTFGIISDYLEYFAAIWYNLWPIGIVCSHLVNFSVLVCLDQEKSCNPGPNPTTSKFKHNYSASVVGSSIDCFTVGKIIYILKTSRAIICVEMFYNAGVVCNSWS